MWPNEEYSFMENMLLLTAFAIPPLVAYFIVRPMLFSYWERRSEPVEEGTDIPDEEYWND